MSRYRKEGMRLFIREHAALPGQTERAYVPVNLVRTAENDVDRCLRDIYNDDTHNTEKISEIARYVELKNMLSRKNTSFDTVNREYEYHLTPEQAVKFRRLIEAYEK